MAQEIKIRIGTPADMDEIMKIAIPAAEENGWLNPCPQRLAENIWPPLCGDHGLVGIIGKPGEKVEGCVVLSIGKMWYSNSDVVEEKAIFVHPDYRNAKGGRASKLVEFSKRMADELGMPLIIGVLSTIRTEAKVRMYKRQFGEPAGAFFLYGAKSGGWSNGVQDGRKNC